MSISVKGLTVAFKTDVSEEYCKKVINAIKMIEPVANVIPVEETPKDYFAKEQVKNELRKKFYRFIDDAF